MFVSCRFLRPVLIRFESFVLRFQVGVLLRESIDTILQVTIVFLQLRKVRLQLLILLARFCILTGHQRQAQHRRECQTSDRILSHFCSSPNLFLVCGGRMIWVLNFHFVLSQLTSPCYNIVVSIG